MKKFSLDGVTRYETKSGVSIYKIPVSTPFPVGKINTYLIDADERVLVDTGPYSEKSYAQLHEKLAALNIPVSSIRHIVITHGHMDHHGQIKRLLEHADALVYVHPYDREKIEDFGKHRDETLVKYTTFLKNCSVADNAIELILSNHHRFSEFCADAPVNVEMNDGDEVTPLKMKVIHTPGHQEGSVCLLYDDMIFTGDNVLRAITPNPFCKALFDHCGLTLYLNSIKRLLALPDVGGSLPGHGSEIDDLRKRVSDILKHHTGRTEKIVDACRAERTIFDITVDSNVFPKIRGGEIFLAIIEVASHLEHLLEEKKVERIERNGVHFYKQIQ